MKTVYIIMTGLISLVVFKYILISLNTASTFQVLLTILGILLYLYIAIKTKFFTQINFKSNKK